MTNQKIPLAKSATLLASLVSPYSHNMAKTEVKGSDANSAPSNELRLDTSEMVTMIKAVIITLLSE